MGKNSLTEEDIINLVKTKMREPNMELEDMYTGITEITPSAMKKIVCHLLIPCLIILVSLYLIIFQNQNNQLLRSGHLGYIVSSVWICAVLKHYKKQIFYAVICLCIFWYIASIEKLDVTELWNVIKDIL